MDRLSKFVCGAICIGGVASAVAGPLSWQNEPEGTGVPLSIRYRLPEEAIESPRVRLPQLPSLSYPELPPVPDFTNAPAAEPLAVEEQSKTEAIRNLSSEPQTNDTSEPAEPGHWEIERRIKAWTPGRYSFGAPERLWVSEAGSDKVMPPTKKSKKAKGKKSKVIESAPIEPEGGDATVVEVGPAMDFVVPAPCTECAGSSTPLRPVADYPIPYPPITGRLPGPVKARVNYGLPRPVW